MLGLMVVGHGVAGSLAGRAMVGSAVGRNMGLADIGGGVLAALKCEET